MTVAALIGLPVVSLTFPVNAAVVTPCPETTEDAEKSATAKRIRTDDFSDLPRVIASSQCVDLRDATGFGSCVKTAIASVTKKNRWVISLRSAHHIILCELTRAGIIGFSNSCRSISDIVVCPAQLGIRSK